jgi:lysophospholipase L1-like esterase
MRAPLLQWLALAALAGAGAAPSATAASTAPSTPPGTKIGAVRLADTAGTRPLALLVPVRYPLYMAGRRATVRVGLLGARSLVKKRARATARLAAGLQRRPDLRRSFLFVHRVRLGKEASPRLPGVARVRIRASARLDVEGDGHAEARSVAVSVQRRGRVLRIPAAATCASVPVMRVRPGRVVRFDLPACDRRLRWSLSVRPRHGKARRVGGRIGYRAGRRHHGLDELVLRGRPPRAAAVTVPVRLYSGRRGTAKLKVRALGDSVTAGFGYYADGSTMSISNLLACRPAASGYNDACSSNSLATSSSTGRLSFAPDYGLAHDVSWPAQWANAHGITNYTNVAVSGSAPGDWRRGGTLHRLTRGVESADPDYVVLTLGANPLLADVLAGGSTTGCAREPDLFGGFTRCVLRAFASVGLQRNLSGVYRELLAKTDATILLMQYHLSIPAIPLGYTPVQVERFGELVNEAIASVARSLRSRRLRVIAPPRFYVGIDMTPLAPNRFSCSGSRNRVDGPSVQATIAQDALRRANPLSFCEGPAGGGPPWVISADTGIHPSAAGYTQMAGALPPP